MLKDLIYFTFGISIYGTDVSGGHNNLCLITEGLPDKYQVCYADYRLTVRGGKSQ